MKFSVSHRDGYARCGRLQLAHGSIDTPAFMPVGTAGAVKTVTPDEVRLSGAQIILGNTFHLGLRPGTEVIETHGGLHRFMGWDGPILTDSGGFQVWSLAADREIHEAGVRFRSPVDGSIVFLGPEESMRIQRALGSDVVMAFDECTAYPASREQASESMLRSLRWARRCRAVALAPGQVLFGIAQGGMYEDLRIESLAGLEEVGFDGYALGGLSVGEPKAEMTRVLETITPVMPAGKPRYLMGVGKPEDLLAGVAAGIDMFDCVLPTRNARNGWLYTVDGIVRLKNAVHRSATGPVEEGCECPTCSRYSRSYLRHLHSVGEMLGARLCTIHNLYFFQSLMRDIRAAVTQDRLAGFARGFLDRYASGKADVA